MTTSPTVIDYVELPADDVAETKRFYAEAFGWQWTDYGPTYAAYEAGPTTIGLNGGGTAAPAHEPGAEDGIGPLVLFGTDDLTSVLARVRDSGGHIASEPYRYPGGTRFHFRDPSGNTLGVYQSDAPA